ncbi:MAG: glycosyltransferase [Neptuniibacter sp.]
MGNIHIRTIHRLMFLTSLYLLSFLIVLIAFNTDHSPSAFWDDVRTVLIIIFAPIALKYFVQLSTSPFYYLIEKRRQAKGSNNKTASVSVLIPAWNEEVGIIKTVNSVLDTKYPALEIIVINDGSTDQTDTLMKKFLRDFKRPESTEVSIKYFSLENGGKARALNFALEHASGEIIITIDADSLMHPESIKNMVPFFSDPEVAAVAGNVTIGNREKPIGLIQQLEYLYGFFFKRADSIFNSVYIIGGAAAAYRKDILKKAGGFNHQIITEDIEISTRLLKLGYKTRYAADAITYTEGPSEYKGLCNQRLRWKFGRFQTFWKHRELFFSCSSKHSFYLSWFLLPLAVYSEILLLLELPLLTVFFGYMISTGDYVPLLIAISFFTLVVCFQLLADKQRRYHANLLPLVPVGWIVCYIIDAVELQAILRSIKRFIRNEDLQWQKWIRAGLPMEQTSLPVERAGSEEVLLDRLIKELPGYRG